MFAELDWVQTLDIWRMCLDLYSACWIAWIEMFTPCALPAWWGLASELPSCQVCVGCILLTALSLYCTPTSLPSPPFHTTEVRDSVCVHVSECKCVWSSVQGGEKKSWSVYGEKLSSFSAGAVVRSVVLKNSDSMSPTSPCCKQGLISAFIRGTSVWGACARAHSSVTSLFFSLCFYVCEVCVCVPFFPAPYCLTVQYLSSVCGEDRLEDDLRINAILKQNTTCQIFTPSLPSGDQMWWFSWREVNISTQYQKKDCWSLLIDITHKHDTVGQKECMLSTMFLKNTLTTMCQNRPKDHLRCNAFFKNKKGSYSFFLKERLVWKKKNQLSQWKYLSSYT